MAHSVRKTVAVSCEHDSERDLSFAFTAVKIQVEVFWIMTPCSVVVGYQSFGSPCCSKGTST
jgi:hypothetical protein